MTKELPKINDCYIQSGQRWRVIDITAEIITLKAGNNKRPDRIIHLSELCTKYKKLNVKNSR